MALREILTPRAGSFWIWCFIMALTFGAKTANASACGYELRSGTYSTWPGGYQGWVEIENVSGAVGTDFQVLLDTGNATIANGYQADFSVAESAYLVDGPSWLAYQKIKKKQKYRFAYVASGAFDGIEAYILSINGVACDTTPPAINLTVNQELFTSEGVLVLSAPATDATAVRKVVFEQDGEPIGEVWGAPYQFDLDVDASANGRHTFTATAVDPNGNSQSDTARVLVAIDNRFVGTATNDPADYDDLLDYFDQLTPGNAGKWGSVEAVRDEMNFAALDVAHDFAEASGMPFHLHTLVWGQQQPAWVANLPAAEQRAELEEWFAALAGRYDHVASIDVVNEPLHAVPSYAAALGGAGATGFDWVIEAFELARQYFPNSELLLNDYQVLAQSDLAAQYVSLIELLHERDLIDGIGVQGHFLERVELPVVEANLAMLAATGLGIYITEFDVNLLNDARHAQVFSQLFDAFWQNPSVLGVTHWGHAEGRMWQANAWLINQDGTPRPALDWLVCYRSGETECPLPEYIPQPWVGDEQGLTLEAELWDNAEGVSAAGNVVAYADGGDWLSFQKVYFEENWDKLWLTYAKGSSEASSISIVLDDPAGTPLLTVALPPTASWGTVQTLEVALPAVTGKHAVFVQFNGTYGVANLDNIRFGSSDTGSTLELVSNGDFEAGTSGWYSWNGVVSATNLRSHSGAQSLLVDGSGTGPAASNLTALVTAGKTYDLSYWVTIGGAASSDVRLTLALTCSGTGTQYSTLASNPAVADGVWVNLAGNVTIPAGCSVTQFQPYVEGNGSNIDLYVDDVHVVTTVDENELVNHSDFEANTNGWYSWVANLSLSNVRAFTGTHSLKAAGTGTGPVATNLASAVEAGSTYDLSFWVTVGGVDSSDVRLTLALGCSGNTTYHGLANAPSVSKYDWTELAGSFTIPAGCDVTLFQPYVEGNGAGVDLYVDNVQIAGPPVAEPVNLIANGEFETNTSGWYSWVGALSSSTAQAHSGTHSLLVTGNGTGPAATNLGPLVTAGKTYELSYWVTVGKVPSADVRLTLALGCSGTNTYATVASNPAVQAGVWTELAGTFTVPADCTVTLFQPYVEGNTANVDLYVDSVFVGY